MVFANGKFRFRVSYSEKGLLLLASIRLLLVMVLVVLLVRSGPLVPSQWFIELPFSGNATYNFAKDPR